MIAKSYHIAWQKQIGNAMKETTFPMGYGQKFTKKSGEYPTITYRQIELLASKPLSKPKEFALWFIPSAYSGSWARTHLVQQELGEYWVLAADIDEESPEMDFVIGSVEAALGDVHMLVYSSSNASPGNKKWRVLVPLDKPLNGLEWIGTQTAFFDLLKTEGLILDRSLERTGQPIYLPNVPPEKRNKDMQPLFYQYRNIVGAKYALS